MTVDEFLVGVRNAVLGCEPQFSENLCATAAPIVTVIDGFDACCPPATPAARRPTRSSRAAAG